MYKCITLESKENMLNMLNHAKTRPALERAFKSFKDRGDIH
jgi:competence CoiA-like predicted nuclease